jgi:hypothetical protein
LRDLVRNENDVKVAEFLSNAIVIARPVVTNSAVPAERVAALRRAFDATLADPVFLDDAAKQSLEIGPKGGAELQQIVAALIDAPPDVLERIRRAIQIKSAEQVKGFRPAE